MEEIAIKAENVGKYYRLGQINTGMLYTDVISWISRKTGWEDKTMKIGENPGDRTGFWALDDISFEIHQGDRVGIIGKNGAGKSTLLKVISRVTAPTKGRIGIKGNVASLLEVGTGFHPEMTGRENIYLNGAILGMKRAEINEKIDEIIAFSEIDEHIDTPVKRYSSGMYVRLAFAVAAHLDSDILIADEVLAVGDAEFQKRALGKMNDLSSKQGRTVLFVSHRMNAVKTLCKNGILLDHGKIVLQDDIEKCINRYQQNLYDRKSFDNLSHYDNEFFDLLDYSLVDKEGHELSRPVGNDESVFVRIELNMKKVHHAFTSGYALYNSDGILLYWSYLTDDYHEDRNVKQGINILTGEIPNHFLNEGEYYIYFSASLHYIQWLVNPEEDSPCLKLNIQGGLSDSPFWPSKRPGVCAPVLKWTIEYNK
ncbi:MAG: ATP-binding cassette domain-containing protein [Lachnospiraceae bacterium]|nr:ATP-binding cassette domain-containing protein [Lachnospiraceae bacterium]